LADYLIAILMFVCLAHLTVLEMEEVIFARVNALKRLWEDCVFLQELYLAGSVSTVPAMSTTKKTSSNTACASSRYV
jgi:hypothetical protein